MASPISSRSPLKYKIIFYASIWLMVCVGVAYYQPISTTLTIKQQCRLINSLKKQLATKKHRSNTLRHFQNQLSINEHMVLLLASLAAQTQLHIKKIDLQSATRTGQHTLQLSLVGPFKHIKRFLTLLDKKHAMLTFNHFLLRSNHDLTHAITFEGTLSYATHS